MNRADIEIIEIRKHGEMAHEANGFTQSGAFLLRHMRRALQPALREGQACLSGMLPSRAERSLAVLGS